MKRNNLRLLAGIIIAGSLVMFSGCSSKAPSEKGAGSTSNTQSAAQSDSTSKGPTQKELNDKLKAEAVKADFIQLNGHEDEYKGKKVFIEGEVTIVTKTGAVGGEFTVTAKEGNGFGMYGITSLDTANNYEVGKDINKGDKIRVYGIVDGRDSVGLPHIVATVIEK